MDLLSIAGLVVGILAVVLGQVLEGGQVLALLQPTALLVVIGGTTGAVMLQSPWPTFVRGMRMVRWVFRPPDLQPSTLISQIVGWSAMARKDGLLALDSRLALITDPFMRKGVQLLVDGIEPERIRDILDVEISTWEEDLKHSARIWESAGGYAPTIGILGAVMGLIHVMEQLSDPSRLGAGIAVAFVATLYGVGSANLVFLPIARKLQAMIARHVAMREMIAEGMLGIARGENPRIIQRRLEGYLA